METFLNIIPIIVPTIVAVGVMVFVSYRNKNAADNHQVRISPVLCIIFNVVLIIGVAFFIFIMLYTNEYPVFIWILFACMLAVDIILTLKSLMMKQVFITKILSAGVKDMSIRT